MKVTIIKGPMFEKIEQDVYRYISMVLTKQSKEKTKEEAK